MPARLYSVKYQFAIRKPSALINHRQPSAQGKASLWRFLRASQALPARVLFVAVGFVGCRLQLNRRAKQQAKFRAFSGQNSLILQGFKH